MIKNETWNRLRRKDMKKLHLDLSLGHRKFYYRKMGKKKKKTHRI
jgi:hypothetical protein